MLADSALLITAYSLDQRTVDVLAGRSGSMVEVIEVVEMERVGNGRDDPFALPCALLLAP